MASNEGLSSSKVRDKKSSSSNPAVVQATQPNQPTPFGSMPKLPGDDGKVDWVRTTIEVKAYFKRFVGYVKVLLEPQPDDPDERAPHAESMGQAFNTVYSLLVEMCGPNETAMRQVFDHALVDVDQYPSTLWNMLEVRFTQARMEKLQGYLNEIGHFKLTPNEENNIFIDRFKKLVGEVRSIDVQQVPTDIGLMAVLKEAMKDEESLWAYLHFTKSMSLDDMLETIAKWKPKAKRSSDAVANYTALPGNLKKANAKKQASGRGSGKDKIGRAVVETRACLQNEDVSRVILLPS